MKNRILIKIQQRTCLFVKKKTKAADTLSAVFVLVDAHPHPLRVRAVLQCVASGARQSRGLRACVLILGNQTPVAVRYDYKTAASRQTTVRSTSGRCTVRTPRHFQFMPVSVYCN